jgi:hypothetical protein
MFLHHPVRATVGRAKARSAVPTRSFTEASGQFGRVSATTVGERMLEEKRSTFVLEPTITPRAPHSNPPAYGERERHVTFTETILDIRPYSGYTTILAPLKDMAPEAHRVMGARAVPAGGFAVCFRAAWASCLPALRPGWEVHPWTGTGEGG